MCKNLEEFGEITVVRVQKYIHVSTGITVYPTCFNPELLVGTSLMIMQSTRPNKFKSLVVEIKCLESMFSCHLYY